MKKPYGWATIKVRRALHTQICIAVQKNVDPTITNPSQFADLALREKLDRLTGSTLKDTGK